MDKSPGSGVKSKATVDPFIMSEYLKAPSANEPCILVGILPFTDLPV